MKIHTLHSWDVTAEVAEALQRDLAARVDARTPLGRCELVAGADAAYSQASNTVYAGVVVLRTSDWALVETQGVVREVRFPYVPGALSFREAPALLDAFAALRSEPDAVICDGAGMAHPRRFGLACHVGLWLQRPCVGCAKSWLTGEFSQPGQETGAQAPLRDGGEVIGSVVRTRTGVRPLFVSVGHRIDLAGAARLVLDCCRGCRQPEPIREANHFVNDLRREGKE